MDLDTEERHAIMAPNRGNIKIKHIGVLKFRRGTFIIVHISLTSFYLYVKLLLYYIKGMELFTCNYCLLLQI
jgi:hypothetical protein